MGADDRERQRLTVADIGAWLFKCNPQEWDIEAALKRRRPIDGWRVFSTYRLELIEPRQPAILWVTGSSGRTPTPGIWFAGYTTGAVVRDGQGDEYWIDETERRKLRPYVGLQMARLKPVLTRPSIVADPRTAGLEVLRAPKVSNPSYLTHAEKTAVEEMMGGWPQLP